MDTHVRTPQEVFIMPQHLVVPPFQRAYVWDQEEQWAPLWHDIRRIVEDRLNTGASSVRHFLGAIVLQSMGHVPGEVQDVNVIDGQQRLTTIQLLMDSAAALLSDAELDDLAGQLQILTHNQTMYVSGGDNRLKVRHTNRDREAFEEVMEAESPIDYSALKHSGSLIARAHRYFTETIEEWLGVAGSPEFGLKAAALVDVLTRGIQLVTINLEVYENPQEIFETLNARGTPLAAADLIRNFVFQKLESEGVDTKEAYAEHWPFDTPFWEVDVSVGRQSISRASLFFNQWLGSRLGEEVSPKSTFNRFKQYVERVAGEKMSDLLPVIKQQANQYEAWTLAAEDKDRQLTRVEMSVYRMKATDVELLKPVLIWLHAPDRNAPQAVIEEVIGHLESWIIRRQLLRLPTADLGRIVADIIRLYSSSEAEELPTLVRNHLMNLNVASTYWPGDDEVRYALQTEPVFRRYKRARLRMVLEAIENQLRIGTNQPQVPRRGYPIEHILPQKWTSHWPVQGLEAELERAAYVHRLGNLTLLTGSLNSKVSNGPWNKKRAALQQHDTLLLNSRLLAVTSESGWDEGVIDRRAEEMIDLILAEWPVPEGHRGEIVDKESRAVAWVQLKDLIDAGLIDPGTKLVARPSSWAGTEAVVTTAGLLTLDGQVFDSPSGAATYLAKRAANGWSFWGLPDGRRLADLRTVYKSSGQRSVPDRGWVQHLHIILEAMPDGRWTTLEDLSEALGVGEQEVSSHLSVCSQCAGWTDRIGAGSSHDSKRLDGEELAALTLQNE